MRIQFREVTLTGKKSCKCSGCGKRLWRQKKFWQRRPKSEAEIYAELGEEIKQWKRTPETCRDCEERARRYRDGQAERKVREEDVPVLDEPPLFRGKCPLSMEEAAQTDFPYPPEPDHRGPPEAEAEAQDRPG